jgi:hypothetical protein
MSTSLADLLWMLDAERDCPPGDAAPALQHAGALLSRLTVFGIDVELRESRTEAVCSLAGAATAVGTAWPHQAARTAELAGAVADVAGRLCGELTEGDTWQLAVSTAMLARRWACSIGAAGPQPPAPRLRLLITAADGVRRLAAEHPPRPEQFDALNRPISTTRVPASWSPMLACAESVVALTNVLERRGRSPLTVRQLIGVCRAAEAVAEATERTVPDAPTGVSSGWQNLRDELARFTDGIRDPGFGTAEPVLALAAQIHQAIVQATALSLDHRAGQQLQRATIELPRIAAQVERELRHLPGRVIVGKGDRPIREERVAEWLDGKAFLADIADLEPVRSAVRELTHSWLAHRGVPAQHPVPQVEPAL